MPLAFNRLFRFAICAASVVTLTTAAAQAGDLHEFVFLSVESHPEGVVVRDGHLELNGVKVAPESVQFSISVGNYSENRREATTVSGEIMLPILINRGVTLPADLGRRRISFVSTVTKNSMVALENFRASSVAGGVSLRPSQSEIVSRIAKSLARLESPNLSEVSGDYLFTTVVESFIDGKLFADLAREVSRLTDGYVEIQDAHGNPPDERGLLKGQLFGMPEPHFLVHGSERYPIEVGTPSWAVFTLGLKPVTIGKKIANPNFGAKPCASIFAR